MKSTATPNGTLISYLQRGAAFSLRLEGSDSVGTPIDYSGFTFKGEVRTKADVLVGTLTVDRVSTGVLRARCDDTTLWPIADLYYDIYIIEAKDWLIERSICRVSDAATEVV